MSTEANNEVKKPSAEDVQKLNVLCNQLHTLATEMQALGFDINKFFNAIEMDVQVKEYIKKSKS